MHLCTVGIVVPEMLGARYLIILALAISTKSKPIVILTDTVLVLL